ncbi:MAG: hypothetical protein GEV13_33345 [Rhodospirillales bacterium]|nr:hypothetical protein [Rhodospirillales bacterium]
MADQSGSRDAPDPTASYADFLRWVWRLSATFVISHYRGILTGIAIAVAVVAYVWAEYPRWRPIAFDAEATKAGQEVVPLKEELAKREKTIAQLKEDVAKAVQEVAAQRAELSKRSSDQSAFDDLSKRLVEREKTVEQLKRDLESNSKQLADARNRVTAQEREIETLAKRVANANSQRHIEFSEDYLDRAGNLNAAAKRLLASTIREFHTGKYRKAVLTYNSSNPDHITLRMVGAIRKALEDGGIPQGAIEEGELSPPVCTPEQNRRKDCPEAALVEVVISN